jgi:hypothetical protein
MEQRQPSEANRKESARKGWVDEEGPSDGQLGGRENEAQPCLVPLKDRGPSKQRFERMCEKLTSKLDSYFATAPKKQSAAAEEGEQSIRLTFSELYKHWNVPKN